MNTLSVCLVTKNEAHNITDCLQSVAWANEIIVIDSHSTDDTVALCEKFTNKILITDWKGCGPQKKQAFELATCDWVLMLDADERVSESLAKEIQALLAMPCPPAAGYYIPFQSHFCGKPMYFGDLLGEKHLRLFKRASGVVVPRLVHFRVEVTGKLAKLRNKIIHHSFPSLTAVLNKMNTYSSDGAQHKFNQGRQTSIWSAIGHGTFAFIRGYFLKLGFLDGRAGFILAFANAEGSFYRYLKLMELQAQQPKDASIP